jgi:hypothetical protein
LRASASKPRRTHQPVRRRSPTTWPAKPPRRRSPLKAHDELDRATTLIDNDGHDTGRHAATSTSLPAGSGIRRRGCSGRRTSRPCSVSHSRTMTSRDSASAPAEPYHRPACLRRLGCVGRQSRSQPVSADSLCKTGIFADVAGDFRRLAPCDCRFGSLETKQNTQKARVPAHSRVSCGARPNTGMAG